MKKVLGLIFTSLLALSGCGQTNTATTESSSSASSVDSSSQASQVKEEIKETTKVFVGKVADTDARITVVYTDVVKQFTMELMGDFGNEIPAEVSVEELQALLRGEMATSPEYLEIKDEPGVSMDYFVTEDKNWKGILSLDFEKANVDKIKNTYYFKDLLEDVEDFKKPNIFIAGLKVEGFKEESTTSAV